MSCSCSVPRTVSPLLLLLFFFNFAFQAWWVPQLSWASYQDTRCMNAPSTETEYDIEQPKKRCVGGGKYSSELLTATVGILSPQTAVRQELVSQ